MSMFGSVKGKNVSLPTFGMPLGIREAANSINSLFEVPESLLDAPAEAPKEPDQSDHDHEHDHSKCKKSGGVCRGGTLITPAETSPKQPEPHRHGPNCNKPGCCRQGLIEVKADGSDKPKLDETEILQGVTEYIFGEVNTGNPEEPKKSLSAFILGVQKDTERGPFANRAQRRRGERHLNTLERFAGSSLNIRPEGIRAAQENARKRKAKDKVSPDAPNTGNGDNDRPPVPPTNPTGNTQLPGLVLKVCAELIRKVFHKERFSAIIASIFNHIEGATSWGKNNILGGIEWTKTQLDPKYAPVIDNLSEVGAQVRQVYENLFPKVFNIIKSQYPDAPKEQLEEATAAVLDQQQQLSTVLFVLTKYTEALGQMRDGLYEPLTALIKMVDKAYNLFTTGDADGARAVAHAAMLKGITFTIGGVFLAHAGNDGPATLPGALGPLGCNLILVPNDEIMIIMVLMCLYLHEFRHDMFHAIKGLEPEAKKRLLARFKAAIDEGRIKIPEKFKYTKWAGQTLLTLNLYAMLYVNTYGENDADLVGGLAMCGYAFLLLMMIVFSAFNTKGDDRSCITEDELLRSSSWYEIDENNQFSFEAHLTDVHRVLFNALALEMMGFPEEAEQARALVRVVAGKPFPKTVVYDDAEGKRPPLTLHLDILAQFDRVAVESILHDKMDALGGHSNSEIVMWTPKFEAYPRKLAGYLAEGRTDIPSPEEYHPLHVGPACVYALWEAVAQNKRSLDGLVEATSADGLKVMKLIEATRQDKGKNQPKEATPEAGPAQSPTAAPNPEAPPDTKS